MISWLGYLDSNQGITVSETVVLPLDYIPIAKKKIPNSEMKVKNYLLFIVFLSSVDLKSAISLL